MDFVVKKIAYGQEMVAFQTREPEFVPTADQIASMERAGYRSFMDGKPYKNQDSKRGRGRPRKKER